MKFKTKLISIASLDFLLSVAPWSVLAQTPEEVARCQKLASQFGGLFDWVLRDPAYCSIQGIILKAINLGLGLAGAVAILFITVGGFWYLTSGGSEEQADKGKKTLTHAVIGLVVILMAAVIVRITANLITSSTPAGTANPPAGGTPPGGGTVVTPQGQAALIEKINALVKVIDLSANGDNGKLSASAILPVSDEQHLAALCGTISTAHFNVKYNGQVIGPNKPFAKTLNGQRYQAFTDASFSPGTTGKVEWLVCGATINEAQVTIKAVPGGSGATTATDSEVQAAVSRSSFSVTTTDGGKKMVVNITASSADVDKICSRSTDKNITLVLNNGQKYPQPNTVRQFTVDIAPNTALPDVAVEICGSPILKN